MIPICLLKQGLPAYVHIEQGIERALGESNSFAVGDPVSLPLFYHAARASRPSATHVESLQASVPQMLEACLAVPAPCVLLLNGFLLERNCPGFFERLRAAGKRVVAWQIDDPYYIDYIDEFISWVDVLLTVDSSALAEYARVGRTAYLLPLGFDPAVHRPKAEWVGDDKRYDVSFIGTPFKDSRRVELINALAGPLASLETLIAGASIMDTWARNLPNHSVLQSKIRDAWIDNTDVVEIFARSRINLNLHKDSYGHAWDRNARRLVAQSPCERTFLIAACGGFQLVDDSRPDLAASFESGSEIVTFSDAGDLRDKINFYLSRPAARDSIANRARVRALKEHSYSSRMSRLAELLRGG